MFQCPSEILPMMSLINKSKILKKLVCNKKALPKYSTCIKEEEIFTPYKKSMVTPALTPDKLKTLHTATGLRVTASYISWCQAEITGFNCNILNWQCDEKREIPLNANIMDVVAEGIQTAADVPDCDAYVMEKQKSNKTANSAMFQVLMRQQQLTSIILTELALRRKNEGSSNALESLHLIKTNAPAQMFNLFLGHEIVSASRVIEKLFNNQISELKNVQSINFDEQFRNYYKSSDNYKKEELSKSLLLLLAFIENGIIEQRLSIG